MPKTVLYLDDLPDEAMMNLLGFHDYRILLAQTVEEAALIAQTHCVHIALFDMRLEPSFGKDFSGLHAVKRTEFSGIPKIIWTHYDDEVLMRDAKNYLQENGLIDIVSRKNAISDLENVIEKTLKKEQKLNWETDIFWSSPLSFSTLAGYLNKLEKFDYPSDHLRDFEAEAKEVEKNHRFRLEKPLSELTLEIKSLFCKLFHHYPQVVVDKPLAQGLSWVNLPVTAFDHNNAQIRFLVFLGSREIAERECEGFLEFVNHVKPGKQGQLQIGASTTKAFFKNRSYYFDASPNFAATAYRLLGSDSEDLFTLATSYWRSNDLQPIFNYLFSHSLKKQPSQIAVKNGREANKDCKRIYSLQNLQSLQKHIEALGRTGSDLEPSRSLSVICAQSSIRLTLNDGVSMELPNPLKLAQLDELRTPSQIQYSQIHGGLDVQSIIVSAQGRTWLVKHTNAQGESPRLCDFVSLELSLKFELMDTGCILSRLAFENELLEADLANLNTPLEDSSRKTLESLKALRQTAVDIAIQNSQQHEYNFILFFATLGFLNQYNSHQVYTRRELICFTHALLSAALIGQQLQKEETSIENSEVPLQARQSIWANLDKEEQREIYIEGIVRNLNELEYKLLAVLLGSPMEIVEYKILSKEIDPQLDINVGRVHKVISNINKQIKEISNHKYIENERGIGYRFKHNPGWHP